MGWSAKVGVREAKVYSFGPQKERCIRLVRRSEQPHSFLGRRCSRPGPQKTGQCNKSAHRSKR